MTVDLVSALSNWHYLYGKPAISGSFKTHIGDFKVTEKLSFEPSGDGEHVFLKVEKQGLNTAYVAEELARFCGLPLRNVTYAGRKDKYSVSTQWFGIYPEKSKRFKPSSEQAKLDWKNLDIEGLKVVETTQNQKKLRTGAIESNHFEITLRNVSGFNEQALTERLDKISQYGVPNYFGQQRFGEQLLSDGTKRLGGNLKLAQLLIEKEIIKNRNKRSMAISALRSWLFNSFVSDRIKHIGHDKLMNGDVLMLSGSNSFFIYSDDEEEIIQQRIYQDDVQLSAPLWGNGVLASQSDAYTFECKLVSQYQKLTDTLDKLGLEQQRRALLVKPNKLEYQFNEDILDISFELPSGCFATSVLREIAIID